VKTILVGHDGTRSAERALTRVAELAQAFNSNVIVVSVSAPEPVPTVGAFGLAPYYYPPPETGDRPDDALWEQHRKRVQAFFGRVDVRIEFAGVIGQPAEEIVELAGEHKADLIVVGTREPGFVERLLGGGSVSQDVARRAHCDVLIVHPPAENDG